jgi:hypothetical protein
MNQKTIWKNFSDLPPEAQRQVMDFMAFLQTRYPYTRPRKPLKTVKLAKEPFIGIWRHRGDLQDSTGWVRNVRAREWGRR